jgi:outer membrane protein, heavy metal efflux system
MSLGMRIVLLAAALTAARLAQAAAEDAAPPRSPDAVLSALIQEALDHDPAIRAASASAEAARARPDQVTGLPDPMLSVGYTNDGWSPSLGTKEMTTLSFMWSQALPAPGRRRLRGDRLRAEARGTEQDVERARLGTVAGVRRAYYGLVLARDLRELVKEQETLWTEVEQSVRSRYGVGLGTQHDVLRAQVEVTRIQESLIEQESDFVIRTAELNRLLGRPPDGAIRTDAHLTLRPLEYSLSDLIAEGDRVSPELRAAAAGIEGGQVAMALAQKARWPELSVQAGYMNRGGLDPMWQASVGVSLPRRQKTAAALAEATAEKRASEERRLALSLDLRLRTQALVARASALEKVADLYGEGIVPQERVALQAALASYQAGKLPFVTVLEALRQLYADRAAHLRQIANHERVKAAIDEWSLESTAETGTMGSSGGRGTSGGDSTSMSR